MLVNCQKCKRKTARSAEQRRLGVDEPESISVCPCQRFKTVDIASVLARTKSQRLIAQSLLIGRRHGCSSAPDTREIRLTAEEEAVFRLPATKSAVKEYEIRMTGRMAKDLALSAYECEVTSYVERGFVSTLMI